MTKRIPPTPGPTAWQKIVRQPALLLGLVAAGLTLAVAFHVHLSQIEQASVLGFLTAGFLLLQQISTPASEVIAQEKPGEAVKATAAAKKRWGLKKDAVVHVTAPGPLKLTG